MLMFDSNRSCCAERTPSIIVTPALYYTGARQWLSWRSNCRSLTCSGTPYNARCGGHCSARGRVCVSIRPWPSANRTLTGARCSCNWRRPRNVAPPARPCSSTDQACSHRKTATRGPRAPGAGRWCAAALRARWRGLSALNNMILPGQRLSRGRQAS